MDKVLEISKVILEGFLNFMSSVYSSLKVWVKNSPYVSASLFLHFILLIMISGLLPSCTKKVEKPKIVMVDIVPLSAPAVKKKEPVKPRPKVHPKIEKPKPIIKKEKPKKIEKKEPPKKVKLEKPKPVPTAKKKKEEPPKEKKEDKLPEVKKKDVKKKPEKKKEEKLQEKEPEKKKDDDKVKQEAKKEQEGKKSLLKDLEEKKLDDIFEQIQEDKKEENPKEKEPEKKIEPVVKKKIEQKPTPKPVEPVEQKFVPDAQFVREISSTVQGQIASCWSIPIGAKNVKDMDVELYIKLSKKGEVQIVRILDNQKYEQDDNYRVLTDSAVRAVKECSPIRGLPEDKHEFWKEIEFIFNPSSVL